MRNFETGFGSDDEETRVTDERRQFNEELNDFSGSLDILGEDDLVSDVIAKISSNENTEEAGRILRNLEKQLVEVLDTDEDKAVEILSDFVGDSAVEEEADEYDMAA